MLRMLRIFRLYIISIHHTKKAKAEKDSSPSRPSRWPSRETHWAGHNRSFTSEMANVLQIPIKIAFLASKNPLVSRCAAYTHKMCMGSARAPRARRAPPSDQSLISLPASSRGGPRRPSQVALPSPPSPISHLSFQIYILIA